MYEKIQFDSVKDFVGWLIDNAGYEVLDYYGRRWKYEDYNFYFKDIGHNDRYEKGIDCLHLYGTDLAYLIP